MLSNVKFYSKHQLHIPLRTAFNVNCAVLSQNIVTVYKATVKCVFHLNGCNPHYEKEYLCLQSDKIHIRDFLLVSRQLYSSKLHFQSYNEAYGSVWRDCEARI